MNSSLFINFITLHYIPMNSRLNLLLYLILLIIKQNHGLLNWLFIGSVGKFFSRTSWFVLAKGYMKGDKRGIMGSTILYLKKKLFIVTLTTIKKTLSICLQNTEIKFLSLKPYIYSVTMHRNKRNPLKKIETLILFFIITIHRWYYIHQRAKKNQVALTFPKNKFVEAVQI